MLPIKQTDMYNNESLQREPGALLREVYRKFLRMLGPNPSFIDLNRILIIHSGYLSLLNCQISKITNVLPY